MQWILGQGTLDTTLSTILSWNSHLSAILVLKVADVVAQIVPTHNPSILSGVHRGLPSMLRGALETVASHNQFADWLSSPVRQLNTVDLLLDVDGKSLE